MLLLIIFAHILASRSWNSALGLPFPSIDAASTTISVDPNSQRTALGIAWSCIATIFACTWITVHPNLPPASGSKWTVVQERVKLMVWALIAPELILNWALNQWRGARYIAAQFRESAGWTNTHGFFLQMGGFNFVDDQQQNVTLTLNEIRVLQQRGAVDLGNFTEDVILDKSKGDMLSKAIVVLQTTWFVIQCIARNVQHLPITELELVTLGFASLNALMHFFWWHKPLDVRVPIAVPLKPGYSVMISRSIVFRGSSCAPSPVPSLGTTLEELVERLPPPNSNEIQKLPPWTPPDDASLETISTRSQDNAVQIGTDTFNPISSSDRHSYGIPLASKSGVLARFWFQLNEGLLSVGCMLFKFPSKIFAHITEMAPRSFPDVNAFVFGSEATTFAALLIPRLKFTGIESYPMLKMLRVIFVNVIPYAAGGMILGGIHLIAWSFKSSTKTERTIWHLSSIILLCVPGAYLLYIIFSVGLISLGFLPRLTDAIIISLKYLFVPGAFLYIFARISLLVVAFASLRHASPGDLETIQWTKFIPHL